MTQSVLTLADGGRSAYRIVIDDHATAPVRSAADELRDVLRQAADVTLTIAPPSTAATDCEIILGPGARATQLAPDINVAGLGPEGYVIRTVGKRLLIVGGEPRGTLYGVYAFCQNHLGCRWFTQSITHVPRQTTLCLGAIDERYTPPLQYRNFILNGTDDPHWCARNFYNGFNSASTLELGGRVTHWHYGHSFHDLLKVEEHFAQHPEYFDSVSRGKRVLDDPVQPCCTNDDAARIITDNLRRVIERDLRIEQDDPTRPAPQVYYLAQLLHVPVMPQPDRRGGLCVSAADSSLQPRRRGHRSRVSRPIDDDDRLPLQPPPPAHLAGPSEADRAALQHRVLPVAQPRGVRQ